MVKPKSDSPTTRKLVRAFLDFLNSVELSSDAESESLEVAKDCLETAFKLNSASDEPVPPGILLELFNSWEVLERVRPGSGPGPDPVRERGSSSDSSGNQNGVSAEDPKETEVLTRDELFGRMYAALDKIDFFNVSILGEEDTSQIEKATQIFDEAYVEIERSEGKKLCVAELAEFFKTKGNEAMQSKKYHEAVELYNCAIALCERNAVYYCNRAAAYTNMDKNNEAIHDCLKSIEIDPNYSKAYSRLGSAYFAQGNYSDALYRGYIKALLLDPNNRNIQENIRVTKTKLEQTRAQGQGQDSNPFTSFSFGSSSSPPDFINIMRGVSLNSSNSSIPIDINNILRNMGPTNQGPTNQGPTNQGPTNQGPESNSEEEQGQNGHSEAEIRIDGENIEVNIGDQHEQIRFTDALRSVMQIFSDQMGSHIDVNLGSENRPNEN